MSDTPKVSSFVKGRGQPLEGQVITKKPQKRKPTPRQIKAAQLMAENGRKEKPASTGQILKEAGYSEDVQKVPSKVTDSEVFKELLEQFIPDNDLVNVHKRLLQTRKIEHMVFPLEHQDPSDLDRPVPIVEELREKEIAERRIIDNLSDEDITDMLAEVNCKVKRIIHGETARHVYFWAHDANAQTKALELGYKMKGYLSKADGGKGEGASPFNFNVFQGGQTFVKKGDQ